MNINDLIGKSEIQTAIENDGKNGGDTVSNFWRIPWGKSHVRLLPRPESKVPWKTVWSHRNGADNQIGTCLRTWAEKNCPICQKSWEMYNSEDKVEKDLGYKVRKGVRYIFNAYIVKDDEKPDNVGQIKLLSVGKKLFELISENFNSDDYGSDIFNAPKGFDFIIDKRRNGDYPDYTVSRFSAKKTSVGTWDDIQPKLLNIDETIPHHTSDDLKGYFPFLFGATVESYTAPATKEETKTETSITDTPTQTKDEELEEELDDLLKG